MFDYIAIADSWSNDINTFGVIKRVTGTTFPLPATAV